MYSIKAEGNVQHSTDVPALPLPLQNQTWKNLTCFHPQELKNVQAANMKDCSELTKSSSTREAAGNSYRLSLCAMPKLKSVSPHRQKY